ncbi:MAG: single-stranded DNA-binding protein [Candidatus Pacebacteria bacterium]|nr:single-stranded DNA-binding protein [Candidatus Paceibacterota bacterium]
MNLNKVFLLGNLTFDPEIRTTPSGKMVCSFRVATNRIWTDKQTGEKKQITEYHQVVTWGRLAEIASQYLKKGRLVFIEGRLVTRNWEDQSGNKRSRTEIVAERLQLGPRPASQAEIQEASFPKEELEEEIPIIDEDEDINAEEVPL